MAVEASEWDVRRGALSGSTDLAGRYLYQVIEKQYKKIRDKQDQGQNVTQLQVIVDLKGYNLIQHGCLNCMWIYFLL